MKNSENYVKNYVKHHIKNRLRRGTYLILAVMLILTSSFVFMGFDSGQDKVYDDAGLLTSSQESEIQELLVKRAEEIKCDLIIVTTNDNEGKSSLEYAEDFFMAHDFGYDSLHGDAVLMLIDMDDRNVWISTSGRAIDVMSDARISRTLDDVAEELSAGKYARACKEFINDVYNCFKNPNGQDKYDDYEGDSDIEFVGDKERTVKSVLVKLLISLAVSAIIVFVLRYNAKAKMTVDGHYYAKNNNCRVLSHSDVFVRTTTTKTPRAQSSSGGGGHSSSHRGSGGHHFGGGGRGF